MGDNNYKDLRNFNDKLKQSRERWIKHSQNLNENDKIDEIKDMHNNYLTMSGEDYADIMDGLNNNIGSNLKIQRDATHMSNNALTYLNSGNSFLSDLNEELGDDINELRIEKGNKKRLIEMQRNRLYKYEFIKKILLYVIGVMILTSMILLVEKIFMKKKTTIGSGLVITIISLFCIFLLFKVIDYNNRSKFNFREYDISSGKTKYKKSVYQYDKDMIMGGLNDAEDKIGVLRGEFHDAVDNMNKDVKNAYSNINK